MILTIDIGLRNLALCIMNAENPKDLTTYQIHLWKVYNLLEEDEKICQTLQANGKVCHKICNFTYNNNQNQKIYSCKKHIPKEIENIKHYKKKMVSEILLQEIATLVINKINEIFQENKLIILSLKEILIELQPKINPKMKFISHIIFGKLTELANPKTSIRFVGASKKLKVNYQGPEIICTLKGDYAKRKFISIQYVKWFLENKFGKQWLTQLSQEKKQDDMTDVFLMAINAIHGIKNNKQN